MVPQQHGLFFRRELVVLSLVLACASLSCAPPAGQITGKVTYQGVELPSGTIKLVYDNRVIGSPIKEHGAYHFGNAPVGPVRVTIQSHPSLPPAFDPRPGPTLRIPPRYKDPDQSGLKYTVKKGRQQWDIDLKP